MYKARLQELCQQLLWSLPNYTSIKDGPDHNPRFKASVLINGILFETPDSSKTSKEAQNEAARLAFLHFASFDPSFMMMMMMMNNQIPVNNSSSGSSSSTEIQSLLKNQLQNYAQKRNLSLPLYSCVREGPPHAVRFKANVTFDGQTFESPEFFHTLNEAEHAAAGVALMSLSQGGVEEVESSFYKNLLEEFLRKEGLSLPTYKTDCFGPSHIPTFISIVEIGVDIFQGIAAKTKKQAEMNAAKVAYSCLKERLRDPFPPLPTSPNDDGDGDDDDDRLLSPTTVTQCSDPSTLTLNMTTEYPSEMRSSFLCNRVRV